MSLEWQLKRKWQEKDSLAAVQSVRQDRLTRRGDAIREALRPMGGQKNARV